MKVIELSSGIVAVVDDADFDELAQYRWHFAPRKKIVGYAYRNLPVNEGGTYLMMHCAIMGTPPDGMEVDHRNRVGVDNRRSNLRFATRAQNAQNRGPYSTNEFGLKGVYRGNRGRFYARIAWNGKRKFLGSFETIEEAASAYNTAALEHHGEFANLN